MNRVFFVLVVLLIAAPASAQQTFDDLQGFNSAVPAQRVEGFDQLPIGMNAPLLTPPVVLSGVEFPNAPQVNSSGFSGLFPTQGSPPNYVVVNWRDFALVLARPTNALGVSLKCLGCDPIGGPSSVMRIELRNDEELVAVREVPTRFDSSVRFVGIVSNQAFDRAFITRVQQSGTSNYVIDDVRIGDGVFADGFEPTAPPLVADRKAGTTQRSSSSTLDRQQRCLALDSSRVTGHGTVPTDNAMARNDDRQRIASYGGGNCSHAAWLADS